MTGFSSLPSTSHASEDVHFTGAAAILGPAWAKLPLLTINMLGVQILWSLEFSYGERPQLPRLESCSCFAIDQLFIEERVMSTLRRSCKGNLLPPYLAASPYLLSLGLSKSFMAIVLLAGPLSGLVMQPLIGLCG